MPVALGSAEPVVQPGGVLVDGLAPGGPAVLDHPAPERGVVGGIGPVTLPQGSAHLRAGQPGAVQVEGLLMELPGMGGGACPMLPFHRPKVGLEGRLVVRAVRGVREEPHPFRAAKGVR